VDASAAVSELVIANRVVAHLKLVDSFDAFPVDLKDDIVFPDPCLGSRAVSVDTFYFETLIVLEVQGLYAVVGQLDDANTQVAGVRYSVRSCGVRTLLRKTGNRDGSGQETKYCDKGPHT